MKNNILKIVSIVFVFSLIFTGCRDSETPPSSNPQSTTTTISGNATDGPIYDANVSVYKNDGTYLGSTTTSSTDGKIGNYTLKIKDLPDEYIVKITGGKDTGPDGIINDNDEESFEMSSVGTKSNPTTYITPATSIIANMVQDGISLIDAKVSVKKSLGLPDGVDLTTTNPKTNEIASKAGTFVAQVMKSIPTTNKTQALKSITKEFKAKATTNQSIVTISSTDIVIDDLNLTSIANDVKRVKPDAIVQDEIDKLEKSSILLVKKIKSTIKKIKPIDRQTANEKKEAIASHKALEKLSAQIKKEDIDTLDINKLESFSIKMEDSFNVILEDGIDNLTNDNLDILADVIESNLDKNISSISTNLKAIAFNTKNLDDNSREIYKNLYATMDINNSAKVSNLDKDDIKSIASSMSDIDSDTKELLSSSIASKLILVVQNSTGNIAPSKITKVKNETVDNSILKDKLKSLAIKKKSSSKVQKKSAKLVLDNINKNLKKENFVFDTKAKNVTEALELKTKSKLQALLADNTKSLDEIFDEIKAIEINSKLVKLDEEFDENTFDSNLNAIKTVTSTLRTQKNKNSDIDLTTSFKSIEAQFEQAIENNTSISSVATDINNNVNDYIQNKEKVKVYIEPFVFPSIGGFTMPALVDTNNDKISLK